MNRDGAGGAHALASSLGVDIAAVTDLIAALRSQGVTVATAESVTGGLIAGVLTAVPGSSAVVRGGLVAYATDLKHTVAGVDPDLLATVGAVHPAVARQLAAGARRVCGARWGIGITGVAGPDRQDGHPVGTVHTCLISDDVLTERTDGYPGDRAGVRAAAVRGAISMLTAAARRSGAQQWDDAGGIPGNTDGGPVR